MRTVPMFKIAVYKFLALGGIVIMGIGSFLACLGESAAMVTTGNILLIISLIMTTWGFLYWRP